MFKGLLVLPQAVVENALDDAAAKADVAVPAYAQAAVEIAGKTFVSKGSQYFMAAHAVSFPVSETLGEAAGSFALVSGGPNNYLCKGQVWVFLADRDILYARQHQRTVLFGAMILASTFAALAGLLAAHRAFRRQLELSELKSNFVSSVSHELRAPIASVRLMAENLEGGKIVEMPKQQEYFRFIVQECRRLSSLIENVLDFARIEQGRKQYEFEPTDLTALMQTTVKLMEPYAAEKSVKLRIAEGRQPVTSAARLEPRPTDAEGRARLLPSLGTGEIPTPNIELNIDGRALQQALVNLIDNAIKHSAKGEIVTVGLETNNDPAAKTIHLFVADHGPGVPPEEREKIFERFYRRGSELRRETSGVGIGLSVVKHIVEAHGGRVTVQSEPTRGSRFIIELPVKNPNEA